MQPEAPNWTGDMRDEVRVSRRNFLFLTTAAVAAAASAPGPAVATEETPSPEAIAAAESPQYRAALDKLLAARPVTEARVAVEIPDTNENGNIVPYKLGVETPMTKEDWIRSLTLLSTGNPEPVVATFHFTEFSGRAAVAGRMRIAKSQTVVAVAETGQGEVLMGKTFVAVTVGGCGID